MKKISIFIIGFFVLLLILVSCKGEHEIGTLKVKGIDDVYFKLYQFDKFDWATAIDYEILEKKNKRITPRKFLIGTEVYEDNLNNFHANCFDSIIYLTYRDPNEVFALYDLKTGDGYPNLTGEWDKDIEIGSSLLKLVQKQNPKLFGNWNK